MSDYDELHESREYLLSEGGELLVTCYVCGEKGPKSDCTSFEKNGWAEYICPDCQPIKELSQDHDEKMAKYNHVLIELWREAHR